MGGLYISESSVSKRLNMMDSMEYKAIVFQPENCTKMTFGCGGD